MSQKVQISTSIANFEKTVSEPIFQLNQLKL